MTKLCLTLDPCVVWQPHFGFSRNGCQGNHLRRGKVLKKRPARRDLRRTNQRMVVRSYRRWSAASLIAVRSRPGEDGALIAEFALN
jgi:hypothetical protein